MVFFTSLCDLSRKLASLYQSVGPAMLAALSYIVSVLLVSIWKEYLCFPMFLVTAYGKNVPAVVEQPLEEEKMHPGKNTVTFEARELKSLFLRLI